MATVQAKQNALDLDLMKEVMEDFLKKLDKMSLTDQVELAARLKPIAKACSTIDDKVKDKIKDKLKGKPEGTVPGLLFKAVLNTFQKSKFNQAQFKEDEPELFEEYSEIVDEKRITFELR